MCCLCNDICKCLEVIVFSDKDDKPEAPYPSASLLWSVSWRRRKVEDEKRTAGWQSWVTVTALAADRGGWKENVKAFNMCLMAWRHIDR